MVSRALDVPDLAGMLVTLGCLVMRGWARGPAGFGKVGSQALCADLGRVRWRGRRERPVSVRAATSRRGFFSLTAGWLIVRHAAKGGIKMNFAK